MKIERHCQYCGVKLPQIRADGKPKQYVNEGHYYFCDVHHHGYWAVLASAPVKVCYLNTIFPELEDYPIVRGFL